MSTDQDLAHQALPPDELGLFEALTSTRAIRRYTDDPVPEEALRAMLFAASRGPSGSNRQPFRFIVLRHGEKAMTARRLIGEAARAMWASKRQADGYDSGSGQRADSPKARMARSMEDYVDNFEKVPLLILPCLVRYRAVSGFEGASVYPAVQNLLLAARGLGFGGVITGFHGAVDAQLRTLLGVPEEALIAATVTIGRPRGKHGPVRRRPLQELVFEDTWGESPDWAVDPPGTRYTSAGPPV